jgi:hypothetical protein
MVLVDWVMCVAADKPVERIRHTTEGFDTSNLKEAKALLEELRG